MPMRQFRRVSLSGSMVPTLAKTINDFDQLAEKGNSRFPMIEKTIHGRFGFFSLVEGAGFIALLALAVVTPLFFLPPAMFPDFLIDGPEVIVAKWVFIQAMAMVVGVLAGLALLGPGWRRFLGPALPAALALLLFLLWYTVSALINVEPRESLAHWAPRLALGGCALSGVFFLSSWRRVRILLLALLACGFLVSLIGAAGGLGVRSINRAIYGQDPREAIEHFQEHDIQRQIQGGMVSSGTGSTLANPEYAGTFTAALAVIAAIALLDWAPRARRRNLWRLLLLGLIGLLLLHLTLTGSRQAWVALFLCAMLRYLFFLGLPRRWMAGGFCASLLVALFFGIPAAALLFLGLLGAATLWGWRHGGLPGRVRRVERFNLLLVVGLPSAAVVGLVLFSVPGPWNPAGVRVLQRFASLSDSRDSSLRERMMMYAVATDIIQRAPVFGVGPGRYGTHYLPTLSELAIGDETGTFYLARQRLIGSLAAQAHNDYLQIASEAGLPGLLFFLAMLLFLFDGLNRIVRADRGWRGLVALALMAGLAAYCSIMMTSFPLQMPSRAAVFWALVGASLGLIAAETAGAQPREGGDESA